MNDTIEDEFRTLVIICKHCNLETSQPESQRRRTICPHCGNFYEQDLKRPNPSENEFLSAQIRPGRRSTINVEKQENEKGLSGPLRSIGNFFKNLTKDKNKNSADESKRLRPSVSATQLPPISKDISRLSLPEPRERSLSPNCRSSPSSSLSNGTNIELSASMNRRFHQILKKSIDDLRCEVSTAKDNDKWDDLKEYYSIVFENSQNLNSTFKYNYDNENNEDVGINFDFVYDVYSILTTLPQDIQKIVLKASINNLLKDKRSQTKDDLKAYTILLLNPQYKIVATYMIFAHLLRQIANLSDSSHHYLVNIFQRINQIRFKELISRLQRFISIRLFPPNQEDLPPIKSSSWWIPSATKVLALLNAASNMCRPTLVSYLDFYNPSLDEIDLLEEYQMWQNKSTQPKFSFCQYPFLLSLPAKRTIMQRDSEQQMVVMARRCIVANVQQRQAPEIGMLFLNLTIRRSHLVSDSLNEIALKKSELKKKLKVTFAGEPGLDMGGLTKEWFLLLVRQIFQPEYGMFTFDKAAKVFWFNNAPCDNLQEFNLVGVLMGLAVYNSIILDIRFPPICFKKLISPAVVPYNDPNAIVGVTKATLDDLKQINPGLVKGLEDLLVYDGDVETDFGITFQITTEELGCTVAHDLKPNGSNIPVTNANKQEYVKLYVDYIINSSIYQQFKAFYHGFHRVCASNALILLRPEEIELMVCGNPTLEMDKLRSVTVYDGYTDQSEVVVYFWDIVLNMPLELQKQILLFTTGSDRVPIGGVREMHFKITRVDNPNMLPMAHTCFNQLILPCFKSRKVLKQKLLVAIQNAEGFGLE